MWIWIDVVICFACCLCICITLFAFWLICSTFFANKYKHQLNVGLFFFFALFNSPFRSSDFWVYFILLFPLVLLRNITFDRHFHVPIFRACIWKHPNPGKSLLRNLYLWMTFIRQREWHRQQTHWCRYQERFSSIECNKDNNQHIINIVISSGLARVQIPCFPFEFTHRRLRLHDAHSIPSSRMCFQCPYIRQDEVAYVFGLIFTTRTKNNEKKKRRDRFHDKIKTD